MVVNITQGKFIKGLVNYLLKDDKKPKIFKTDKCQDSSKKAIISDFLLLSSENLRLKKNVLHLSFSFSKDDDVKKKDYLLYLNDYINTLYETTKNTKFPIDLRNTQRVCISHGDTEHPHFHVVFNRVKITKDMQIQTVKDNMIKTASNRVCYILAKKYDLKLNKIGKVLKDENKDINCYHNMYERLIEKEKYKSSPKNIILKNEFLPVCKSAVKEETLNGFFDYLSSKIDVKYKNLNNGSFSDYLYFKINKKSLERYNLFFKVNYYTQFDNVLRFKLKEISPLFSSESLKGNYKVSQKEYESVVKEKFEDNKQSKIPFYNILEKSDTIEDFNKNIEYPYIPVVKNNQIKNIQNLPNNIRYIDIKTYFNIKSQKRRKSKMLYSYSIFENEIESVRKRIKRVHLKSLSLNEFEGFLKKENVILIKKLDRKGNFVGASFESESVKINGSYLNSKFSASKLNDYFSKKSEKIKKK